MAFAYAIAQTVFYDNQYLQLDQRIESQKNPHLKQNPLISKFKPNYNYGNTKPQIPNLHKTLDKVEPMEIDSSNRFEQTTNWNQQNQYVTAQKREYDSSRQRYQQPQKAQRLNQLQDDGPMTTEREEISHIPEDLISNISHESHLSNSASTFLDE